MLNTSANVLCEVVLVFACMLYHADYYRIIVTAYDYECSQHHASFHVYVRMGSEPPLPHPTSTLTNEPMKKTYESREVKKKKKKERKKREKKRGENRVGRLKTNK